MAGDNRMIDAELVMRFQGGEEAAFETLVHQHFKDAYSFCMRLTHDATEAEELSQLGFVNAYRALRRFRGESSFRSWLYRIFINLNRDRIRRQRGTRLASRWCGRRRSGGGRGATRPRISRPGNWPTW